MATLSSIFSLCLAAISLGGVAGGKISAEASLESHNVHVGDPVDLMVDFVGEADFTSLHPPSLSDAVDRALWRIDDKSARTETVRRARRLVYRVRPLKEGLLEFPKLEFSYSNVHDRTEVVIATRPMPVNVKRGANVALAELEEIALDAPMPDGLICDLSKSPWSSGAGMTDDFLFKWQKACSFGKAEGFREFDFPEARLNEAAAELMDGNWAKALKIYSALEWRIGQTREIERGIVAALALKLSDADAELPVWRQVLRPLLRHSWKGRLLAGLAVFAGVFLVLQVFKAILKMVV